MFWPSVGLHLKGDGEMMPARDWGFGESIGVDCGAGRRTGIKTRRRSNSPHSAKLSLPRPDLTRTESKLI